MQHRGLVVAQPRDDEAFHPMRQLFVADDVVEHDLKRPRFQQVGNGFSEYGKEGERERGPVRAQQLSNANLSFLHPASNSADEASLSDSNTREWPAQCASALTLIESATYHFQ